jgi:arginine/lysine/ornithine decarboxylase
MEGSKTPVCDFVEGYAAGRPLRLHMPGHKGLGEAERLDITEIQGADPLYADRGVLKQCADNAAALFGSGRSLLSAEGSSLCVRAMVALARLRAKSEGLPPVILAGRNAHRTFLSAAALMGMEVVFLPAENLLTCRPTPRALREALERLPSPPAAVYLTSPDYLGNRADVRAAAEVCRERGVPLMVDNAHGAYLRFLPEDQHPLTLGADLTCDSAHKTLPVLTGGAYLHIHRDADPFFAARAERAMASFASTSPSWLILQSLDRCNACLSSVYREQLKVFVPRVDALKKALRAMGYETAGDEPLKITLMPKSFGYTGDQLHDLLRQENVECEFSDPDYLVMMVTPETGAEGLETIREVLGKIPRREPVFETAPMVPEACQAMTPAAALMSRTEEVPVSESEGRILADPCVSCPPAVPILISGERITREAIRCFEYYGIDRVTCVAEKSGE